MALRGERAGLVSNFSLCETLKTDIGGKVAPTGDCSAFDCLQTMQTDSETRFNKTQ
jgi:hypothetical protein